MAISLVCNTARIHSTLEGEVCFILAILPEQRWYVPHVGSIFLATVGTCVYIFRVQSVSYLPETRLNMRELRIWAQGNIECIDMTQEGWHATIIDVLDATATSADTRDSAQIGEFNDAEWAI